MASRHETAGVAKSIVAMAFRNGPIENVHAGRQCPACAGSAEMSRITQEEMRDIMKTAVNRVHTLLQMQQDEPEIFDRMIESGAQFTSQWDDPEPDPRLAALAGALREATAAGQAGPPGSSTT